MFRSLPTPLVPTALLGTGLVALALIGCDPKLTGTDGTGGDGGTGGDVQLVVSEEAALVGSVLSMHMDLLRAGLSLAAEFDTVAAPPAPLPREFFSTQCITLTEVDPVAPSWDLSLAGCVDGNGTTYRGGGMFEADGTLDGFTFFPYGDAAEMIIAENSENVAFNHTYMQGTFWFTYERGASDEITGAVIGNYLRHRLFTDVATFSYDGVSFAGGPGSWADWPAGSSVVHVSWDGVGVFDIGFSGGSTASFRLQGVSYLVNMSAGTVTVDPNQGTL